MKSHLSKLFILFTAIICFTVTASAQKNEDKGNDKRNPPVIKPSEDRKPKPDKPKEDKKPQVIVFIKTEE